MKWNMLCVNVKRMEFFCFTISFSDKARGKAWLALSVHTLRALEGTLSRRCLIPPGTAKSGTELICTFAGWDLMDRLLGLNGERRCMGKSKAPSWSLCNVLPHRCKKAADSSEMGTPESKTGSGRHQLRLFSMLDESQVHEKFCCHFFSQPLANKCKI